MVSDNRNAIISEDYADLLIKYSGDENILNTYQNAIIVIINSTYALALIPVAEISNQSIVDYGYAAFPRLYGLISHASLEASGILRIRNVPNFNLRGQGVLIGVIDTGIDYTNPVFQNEDGTTRIVSLWDQTIQSENPPDAKHYGTEYTREQINQALQSENPLEIVPSMDENGHGTMVAGIAGGSVNGENDFEGVATDAEYIVVKLKPAKRYLKEYFRVPQDVLCFQGNDLISAVDYLLEAAFRQKKPIAICISQGSGQGGRSGGGLLSNYLSRISLTPGVVVVTATGNEGNARRHYNGKVDTATGLDIVELNVGENESGFSMELWGHSPSLFSIDILSPSGEYIPRIVVSTDETREITFVFEPTVIHVDYQLVESQTGDQLILIRFAKPSAGIWRFNIYERSDLHLEFNIWLPMEGFISENTFFTKSNPNITILAPGNAVSPLTVTAYNHQDDSIYVNAGRGFTRDGRVKPDLAAPGVNLIAPTLEKGFSTFSGTSISAAHTTGVAAMILEWGVVRGNLPNINTISFKKLAIRGARRDINRIYPNREWGYGILDVYNIFDSLRTGIVI